MSQYLSACLRQDLFSCLLPLCYRNTLTQAHPARSRLLQFLVFLLRYMLLGLLSLVNRVSLNQRAVGSTPTRPTTNQPLTAPPHSSLSPCRHSVGSKTEKISFSYPSPAGALNLHQRGISQCSHPRYDREFPPRIKVQNPGSLIKIS